MDPNKILKNIRAVVARCLEGTGTPVNLDTLFAFAEDVRALDNWMVDQGTLPDGWKPDGAYRVPR